MRVLILSVISILLSLTVYGNDIEVGYQDKNGETSGHLIAEYNSENIKQQLKFISQDLIISTAYKMDYKEKVNEYYDLNLGFDLNLNPRIKFNRYSTKISLSYQNLIDNYTLIKIKSGLDGYKINDDITKFSVFYQLGINIKLGDFDLSGDYFSSDAVSETDFSIAYHIAENFNSGIRYGETGFQGKSDYYLETFAKYKF